MYNLLTKNKEDERFIKEIYFIFKHHIYTQDLSEKIVCDSYNQQ